MSDNTKGNDRGHSGHSPWKNRIAVVGEILFVLITSLTVVLYGGMRYLLDNWSELSMDELIFHLKSTLKGTNPDMIREGLLRYGLPAALIIAAFLIIYLRIRSRKRARRIYTACVLAATVVTLFLMKTELDRKVGLSAYIAANYFSDGSDFIEEHYVDPNDVDLQFPEQKRNLIYIYLESAEITFADKASGGAFEQNVIPELTALAQENEDFSGDDPNLNGGISLMGSTWTMGAMFAQSTGLPLKVPVGANSLDGDNFFPDIAAIGTILEKEGYRQELLIGSDASFGGRRDFYTSHGNYEIRDYNYALENGLIPEDYFVFWGYEDEKLFEFAKKDLLEMAAGDRPFNLTLLTVDTHFEDGYKCRLCRDDFGEQYADAFACSSRQVNDFIAWVQKQDFYENTTIILCGDHPTMDKDFCENVPEEYQRKTLVSVINAVYDDSSFDPDKRREYDTFDMFPTTLAAMNVTIPGNRLGLGVNLYSDVPTMVEEFGLNTCDLRLMMPSKFMEAHSDVRITEEFLESAKESTSINITEADSGKTKFDLINLGKSLSYTAIDKVELELTDKATGETSTYDAKLVITNKSFTTRYYWRAVVELGGRQPEDYDAAFYVTVDGIEHYRVTK